MKKHVVEPSSHPYWRTITLIGMIGCGVASFYLSFHLGSICRGFIFPTNHRHDDEQERGTTRLSSQPVQQDRKTELNNEICNSGIDNSNRLWLYLEAENVSFSNEELLALRMNSLWSDQILSYHCLFASNKEREEEHLSPTLSSYCLGVLQGGGNIMIRSVSPSIEDDLLSYQPRTSMLYYTACGIGGGEDVEATKILVDNAKRVLSRGDNQGLEDPKRNETCGVSEGMSPILWSMSLRLFHFRETDWSLSDQDPLRQDLLKAYLQYKRYHKDIIFSGETPFQRFDVYDVIRPKEISYESHIKSTQLLEGSSTYESEHPEWFRPNRIILLDGVEQSTRLGLEPYHEALVHPGMFSHPNPRRVAIIGGGEGTTLREVLRHDTVDRVTMIEIDEVMVDLSREHLPEWNTCSDIVGSTESCFEDPRADMRYEDAMAWFTDRFATQEGTGEAVVTKEGIDLVDPFDVIIMDALDPTDNVEFANVLYTNDAFFQAVYDGLSEDGVLIMQQGELDLPNEPTPELADEHLRFEVKLRLQKLGFVGMHEYSEPHCGFKFPWMFLIACKSTKCNEHFLSNSAMKDLAIRRRVRPTISGKPALSWIDGNTLSKYQVPRRSVETVYCRSLNAPVDCSWGRGMDPARAYYTDGHAIDVRKSIEDDASPPPLKEQTVRLFAKVDIPKGSYMEAGGVIHLEPLTVDAMMTFGGLGVRPAPMIKSFTAVGTAITPAMFMAVSGVCPNSADKRANVGTLSSFILREGACQTALTDAADTISKCGGECHQSRNPVVARNMAAYGGGILVTLRNISTGEEILFG